MVDTDFPSSGNVNLKYDGSSSFIMTFNPVSSDGGERPGYRLLFWSLPKRQPISRQSLELYRQ